MAKLLLPYDNFLGNLYWQKNEKPSRGRIDRATRLLLSKNYFVSEFPEGDGICFEHDDKDNLDIMRDILEAFPNLPMSMQDTPENRRLIFEMNHTPLPEPGNFYYKICDKKIISENGKEKVRISGPDVATGEPFSVTITKDQLYLLDKNYPVEIVLNHLPVHEREFLISGISEERPF